MKEKKDFEENLKLYEKLGAVQFQKVVFKVEKLKYKLLKKLVPNHIYYYDKHIDKITKRKLKKVNTETEKKEIIYKANVDKMKERKDFYQEQNRNYHMSKDKPTEIIKYLKLNKKIHENGIIRNIIFTFLTIPFVILESKFAILFLILELISAYINFQCINLQNYNICRLEKIENKLHQIEERRRESDLKKYNEISKEIHQAVVEKENIPTIEEIIDRANTPEKLAQLKNLIEQTKKERKIIEIQGDKSKQKVIK